MRRGQRDLTYTCSGGSIFATFPCASGAWPAQGTGHNVRAWAEFLVAVRALAPVTAFVSPFDLDVQRRGQRIEQLWKETLRYRKNYAYLYEMRQVREAAEWFLVNSHVL